MSRDRAQPVHRVEGFDTGRLVGDEHRREGFVDVPLGQGDGSVDLVAGLNAGQAAEPDEIEVPELKLDTAPE